MTPSVGDILMLSQTAWRIGRAFRQGKKSAPAAFAEVEREADRLSEALRVVSETLNNNPSIILDEAEDPEKSALNNVLDSAQQMLDDLDSFVSRYRITKPTGERSWSDLILTNYKTIMWTSEGGSISALRDMLYVHTSTIKTTMQALQSRPATEHDTPASTLKSMHDRLNSTTSDDTLKSASNGARLMGTPISRTSSCYSDDTLESASNGARLMRTPISRNSSYYSDCRISRRVSYEPEMRQQWRENSAYYGTGPWRPENGYAKNSFVDWDFESGGPPMSEVSIGDRYRGQPVTTPVMSKSHSFSSSSGRSPRDRTSSMPRRESTTLPGLFAQHTEDDAEERSSREASLNRSQYPHGGERGVDSKAFEKELPPLPPPPPVPPKAPGRVHQSARPASLFAGTTSGLRRQVSHSSFAGTTSGLSRQVSHSSFAGTTSGLSRHVSHSSTDPSRRAMHSSYSAYISKHSSVATSANLDSDRAGPSSLSDASAFEQALFRNSAILCEVRVTLVEFFRHNPDEEDPRLDTRMVPACKEARVFVIRKRENRANGGTRVVASIWTIGDDGETRIQHKLPEFTETVPSCYFFEPQKVAVPPTKGEINLRFHASQWGDREEKDIRTKWVNYVFESEKHANEFQSAIFGRQLLGSFRTIKTTVIHEGYKGAFAFEKTFANTEVLRLWKDDGVNTPGGAGGVMALLHMSGNFGRGYAKWWMNSSRQQVRVKDEHNKFVKLKGIDIRRLRIAEKKSTASGARSSTITDDTARSRSSDADIANRHLPFYVIKDKKEPERSVTGIRIEFKTEEERARFVDTVKRVQGHM